MKLLIILEDNHPLMHNDIYTSFQDKISASIFNLHKYANYKTILQDQSSSNAKYA